MLDQSFGAWATNTPQQDSLAKMLPKPQWATPPTTPPDAPGASLSSGAVVQVCVSASKGVVLRADVAKDSAKVGTAAKGDALAVIQLKRTASGTVRARTPAGWTTATTSAGKRLLSTREGVCEDELDGHCVLPLLSCSPRVVPTDIQPVGEQPTPRIDLPDLTADALTPPRSNTFSCVYGPATSGFLAALGPVWSKKRCPEGPLGRGVQQPARFISTKMLPMLPEVFNYETSYKWVVDETGVRRTTMVLELEHDDTSLSKLLCYAEEPRKKARGDACVRWELWRRAARPDSTPHERKLASAKYGGTILAFCADSIGKRVGNGECWTLAERALIHAGAARPVGFKFGDEVTAEELRPGDVVQFESARFEWEDVSGQQKWCTAGAATSEEGCIHHTAVLENAEISPRRFLPEIGPHAGAETQLSGASELTAGLVLHVYQQNPKAVHRSTYLMEHLVSGTVKFFRPRGAERVAWPSHREWGTARPEPREKLALQRVQ